MGVKKLMKKIYIILSVFLFFILSSLSFSEQEIQEQLEFEKHVTVKDYGDGQVYLTRHTVKRGEHLLKILRKQYGVALEDLGDFCRITEDVNPQLENIHHLLVGQVILVPYKFEKNTGVRQDQSREVDTVADLHQTEEQVDEGEIDIKKQVDAVPAIETVREEFIEHEVEEGEYFSIILRHYGLTDRKIFSSVTKGLIKKANPDIDDIDKLKTGQIFRIPETLVDSNQKEYTTGPDTQILVQTVKQSKSDIVDEVVPKATLEEDESVVRTISSIVRFFQGSANTTNEKEIPLAGRGTLKLDFSKFPMYELPWGSNFVIDYGSKLPSGINEMFIPEWRNTEIVSVSQSDDAETVLDKIFDACGFFRIEKDGNFTVNKDNIQVSVNGRWVIFKDESLREIYIFNLIKDNSSEFPDSLKQYFYDMGVKILDIKDGLIGEAGKTMSLDREVYHKKVASDPRSLTDSILAFLQPDYKSNYPIQIIQKTNDGFSLEVIADRAFQKDGKWHIIDFHGLPKKIVSIVNIHGINIIGINGNADSVDVIERVLDFCGAQYFSPPAQLSRPSLKITLPGFLVKLPSGDILITRQPFDEDFRQVISEFGVSILQF